ncbi:MAG: hypothetical protein ACYSU4_19845, partial [Planctomycetota bacterium]
KLYIYQRRQQIFSSVIYNGDTFITGIPYLFVRWSTVTNPYTQEKMDFDNAVFFAHGEEVTIDRGMLRDFELIE